MKRKLSKIVLAMTLAAPFMGLPGSSHAAPGSDPDWPCIQGKVPHVSPGMMWAGPPVEEADRSWEKSEKLAALVHRLAERRISIEQAEPMIAAFAKEKAGEKNGALTLLFTGLLQSINQERDAIMSGIARYAGQQRMRADNIRALREELTSLTKKDALSDAEKKRRDELEERLNWETRIYDERTQSLTYVCESPRILEQRLFSLARLIQQHLD